ncbi:MAG: PilZ domain-containing protein [Thermoanaerobaculia bacterium]
MSEERGKDVPEILGRLKSLSLGRTEKKAWDGPERRASKRVELPIPVELKLGQGDFQATRLSNVSLHGMLVENAGSAPPGEIAALQFEGYPGVCEPFLILGRVVRVTDDSPPAVGIEIDFQATGEEAIGLFKTLVRHFLRHRGLLEDVWKGYFEGRCKSCGWIGRVGERSPRCPKCGEEDVEPIADQQGSD